MHQVRSALKKNKEQVAWLVYDHIRILRRSENNSSLVTQSIQSNRAPWMVFGPWEV